MTIPSIESVETEDAGRTLAIEWQGWMSEQNLSYGELSHWTCFFDQVVEKFPGLAEEFKENAIV